MLQYPIDIISYLIAKKQKYNQITRLKYIVPKWNGNENLILKEKIFLRREGTTSIYDDQLEIDTKSQRFGKKPGSQFCPKRGFCLMNTFFANCYRSMMNRLYLGTGIKSRRVSQQFILNIYMIILAFSNISVMRINFSRVLSMKTADV